MLLKRLSAITALLIAMSATALAQSSAINGEITGTVTDAAGGVVVNAKVTASNQGTGFIRTAATSGNGLYRFGLLPLGSYDLRVEAPGFAAVKQTGITVNAGATVTQDVRLEVGGVATEVVVESTPLVIDPGRTDLGRSLSGMVIADVPLISRNPYNFILQQPNVTGRGNTEFGVPRKVDANGFNGRINYQLDGSNNTESDRAGIRLLPISNEWIAEIQTVSNGFAPEFGNTVGTVFNTITKSGSNDFHGTGAYLFRRTPFSSRPALLAATAPTPEVNVDAFNASSGGRVIKDKLFYFGSWEHVKRDLPAPVTVSPATIAQLGLPANFADAIPFAQSVTFFLAKADWQVNDSNRLSMRFNGHRNDSPYNNGTVGGVNLISTSHNFVDRSYAGLAQLISTLSPNMVNELRVQVPYRSQQQNAFAATGTGPQIVIPGVATFGGSVNTGFLYDEKTPEINENLSWNRGSHALKFGTSLRWIRDAQTQPLASTYTFSSIAAYLAAANGSAPRGYVSFVQAVGNSALSYNSRFAGFYGQDDWKVRQNVTIVYGLRYDVFSPPSANKNSPFPFSQSFKTDKNNFAPRLGISVGLGKWVVRANGGIFYDPFQTDQYRKAITNNGLPAYFNITRTPLQDLAPAFPSVFTGVPSGIATPTQDIFTVAPDFASLYSVNANASVSRELGPGMAFTATYLYTTGSRLPVWSNINLIPTGATLADGRPIFGSGRVFPAFNNINVAQSVGKSNYNGLNVTLDKHFSNQLEAFATWTWAHAIDNAPEQN
ncbi:MAG: TonB-dependent receptor, partial [Terriglobia bacterium]